MPAPTDPLHPDNAVAVSTPVLAASLLMFISTHGHADTFTGRREFIDAQRQSRWREDPFFDAQFEIEPPATDRDTYSHAVSAAFDWLYVEGLITRHWDPGEDNRTDEYFAPTAEGHRFLQRAESGLNALEALRAEKLLGFQLHHTIDGRVRQLFLTGETEAAVLIAMKEVEVHMREANGLSNDLVGVRLAREAFKSDGGQLADPDAEPGERVATMELFAGAMGTLRNPVAHRRVDYDDPVQAVEVILFADLLLRMIDRARDART